MSRSPEEAPAPRRAQAGRGRCRPGHAPHTDQVLGGRGRDSQRGAAERTLPTGREATPAPALRPRRLQEQNRRWPGREPGTHGDGSDCPGSPSLPSRRAPTSPWRHPSPAGGCGAASGRRHPAWGPAQPRGAAPCRAPHPRSPFALSPAPSRQPPAPPPNSAPRDPREDWGGAGARGRSALRHAGRARAGGSCVTRARQPPAT